MTKKSHTGYGLSMLALVIVATSITGCRSTGLSMPKMPKMNMFSWNRKPDPATLAGSVQPAGLPESPAAKYDPNAIATTTGKSNSSTAGSAYGYGATGNSLGATPSVNAQAGMAASANGYQTGPYGLSPNRATTSPTNVASTATNGSLPTGSLPSPYGGTYTGSSPSLHTNPSTTATAKTDVPLPSSVTAALNRGATSPASNSGGLPAIPGATAPTMPSTPALPAGYANNASGQIPANTSAYQMLPSPPAYPVTNPSFTNIPVTSVGSLGGTTAGTTNSTPAGANNNPMTTAVAGGLPAIPNQTSTVAAQTSTASSAYQGATTLGTAYSPGSTGRATSYDFSGGQGATPASATSTIPSSAAANSGIQPLLR